MVDDTKRLDGNGLARVWTATQKLVADNINDGVPVNGVVEFDGLEADIPDGYTKIGTRDSRLLIKKGEKTIPVRSTVVNEETASDTDVYSCEYINDKLEDIEDTFSGTTPQGNIVVNSIRSKNMVNVPTQTITSGRTLCKINTSNIIGNITISCNYNNTSSITGVLNLRETESGTNLQQATITPNTSSTLTMTIDVTNYNTIYVLAQGYSAGYSYTLSNFQVEKGSTATTYTPYQELGTDNFKNEEIVVGSIRSKNMINSPVITGYGLDTSTGNTYTVSNRGYIQYIKVNPNTTYTISGCSLVVVCYYNSSRTYLNYIAATTFTTTQETGYIRIAINTNNTYSNIQLEEGSQATEYMPYQNLDMKDSGWIFPTLNSNFTNYDTNDNHTKYRKVGNIITITGHIKTTTDLVSTSQQVIFTLPQEFRPLNEIQTLCQGSGMYHWLLTIRQNGDVTISRYGIDSQDTITTSAWLPFNVIYMI